MHSSNPWRSNALWNSVKSARGLVLVHDLTVVTAAWFAAFWLRFNLAIEPIEQFDPAFAHLPLVVLVFAVLFWFFNLHRGVWRYTSIPDLERIAKVVAVEVLLAATLLFLVNRLEGIPRAVFPLFGILLLCLLSGPRVVFRWLAEARESQGGPASKVLIVGAGTAGEMLARGMLRDGALGYQPCAFVDDNLAKSGKEIQGVRVLGKRHDIPHLVNELKIDIIVLALPSAEPKDLREIVEICTSTEIPVRTLPPLNQLISGEVSVRELRKVSIEDLLGREQIVFDTSNLSSVLTDRVVLVTGGGGSIGSELCRQIARFHPKSLVIFDHDEFSVYLIELELRKAFPGLSLELLLGDVCEASRVEHVFKTHKPSIVFHAAAYKHVPLLEHQVREAVWNNIVGTRTVAEAAERFGCEIFTLISTDKAVNPSSAMGATKRAAERYCQNLGARARTRFITVRFGNVLDSNGSVVPLFRQQIEAGGPVTVTHPEITRFFMTIPEACRLITQAAALGKGGEIFVLDMGEPVNIYRLAEQMITLSGKVPGRDIEIVCTGLRPGEKLHEELFYENERPVRVISEKILLARQGSLDWDEFTRDLNKLDSACRVHDEGGILEGLVRLAPEYVRQDLPRPSSGGTALKS